MRGGAISNRPFLLVPPHLKNRRLGNRRSMRGGAISNRPFLLVPPPHISRIGGWETATPCEEGRFPIARFFSSPPHISRIGGWETATPCEEGRFPIARFFSSPPHISRIGGWETAAPCEGGRFPIARFFSSPHISRIGGWETAAPITQNPKMASTLPRRTCRPNSKARSSGHPRSMTNRSASTLASVLLYMANLGRANSNLYMSL